MATNVTAPVTAASGFPFDEVNRLLRKRCRIYFCTGHYDTGDDNLPFTKEQNLALYGGSGVFMPLGMMDEKVGSIKPKRNMIKTDFHTIPTDAGVTFELNGVRFYPDMITWLDTDEAKGELTLLFVPDGDDGSVFLALSGVGISSEGELTLGGELATIKIMGEKACNEITDVVKYRQIGALDTPVAAVAYDDGDMVVSWAAIDGAATYLVYGNDAYEDAFPSAWTLLDEVATNSFSEAAGAGPKFYKVIAKNEELLSEASATCGYFKIAYPGDNAKTFGVPLELASLDLDDALDDALCTLGDILQDDNAIMAEFSGTAWAGDLAAFTYGGNFSYIGPGAGGHFYLKGTIRTAAVPITVPTNNSVNFALPIAKNHPVNALTVTGAHEGDVITETETSQTATCNGSGVWSGTLASLKPTKVYSYTTTGTGFTWTFTPSV